MSCGSLNTYRNRSRNSLVLQNSNVSRRCNCHGEIANGEGSDQTAHLRVVAPETLTGTVLGTVWFYSIELFLEGATVMVK